MSISLSQKTCVPCQGGVPPLKPDEINKYLQQVSGWAHDGQAIAKTLKFDDFLSLMDFVNKMASLAESEGHHPDFQVSYATLHIRIFTHKISGLTESDFILAAKIDNLIS